MFRIHNIFHFIYSSFLIGLKALPYRAIFTTAADDDAHAIDKAYNGLQGWVDCFEKAELKGYVFGSGIAEPGDAKNHTETLLDAYNLGKSL